MENLANLISEAKKRKYSLVPSLSENGKCGRAIVPMVEP